jgi:hypothetical protein
MGLVLNFPRASGSSQPDVGIVGMIEALLSRARAGDVQSIVFVAAGVDGHPECEMAMDRGHAVNMLGVLRVAESEVLQAIEATTEFGCE